MKRMNYYILYLLCCLSLGAYGQSLGTCNYIMSHTYTKPDGLQSRTNIDYYDGLGRLSGTTLVGASPSGKDIVTRKDYDTLGRLSHEWLPRVSEYSNGKQLTPAEFVNLSTGIYNNDAHDYSRIVYESSPLNRITEQYGPGNDWYDNGKSSTTAYETNVLGDLKLNCKLYCMGGSRQNPTLNRNGNYATGQLYVTEMKDEDGNTSYEFKDRLGQVVLNRKIAENVTYDTYYVYDDFGMICFVLPPRMEDEGITQAKLDELAYQYKYDARHRCIAKKLPGCEWIYYIYDKTDRLIFSQDGNRRSTGEWLFSIPDIFGKECLSGICSNSFDVFSTPLDSAIIKAEWQSIPSPTVDDDPYLGYSLSGVSLVSPTVLQVNYYNDYSFLGRKDLPSETDTTVCYDTDAESEGFGKRYAPSAQGLLTGMLTAQISFSTVAQSTNHLYSVIYYDSHGRVIQVKSGNHLTGGTEKESVAYDFTGEVTQRKHIHSATGKMTQTEAYTYTYDSAGRLLTTTHQLNNGETVTLTDNEYDELGRLASNKRNGQSNLKTAWTYNVRSWMKSINGPLFSQTLHYTNGIGTPCYGGNISSMNWKTGTDSNMRGYRFEYDPLSRLTNAIYGEGEGLSLNAHRFNEQITSYDKNGNILGLKRYGQTSADGYGLIDNLTISVAGNQLKKVDDSVSGSAFGDSFNFKDGVKQSTEYFYDANGNLSKDLNKKIASIQYNCLNLPDRIDFEDGSSISYLYDAAGTKLRVVHRIAGNTTTTDYCGNVIYENGTPKTLLTEAGFVSLSDSKYHYYLQDHQGNNRVIASQDGAVEEVNHYYPFGGTFASTSTSSVQDYKYNGKELDRKGGLDWYDYGARHYDAALGRWQVVDPMAEKYYGISPYNYCANNPIKYIDPTGMVYGDYYSGYSGRFLFNDGIDDNKVYVRTTNAVGNELTVKDTYVGLKEDIPDKTDIFNAFLEKTKESFSDLDKKLKAQESNILFSGLGKYKRKLEAFRKLVTDGAPYDIKVAEGGAFSTKNEKAFKNGYAFYNSQLLRYDDFGNFNYGVAGKAFGLSKFILELGAGVNQLSKPNVPHSIFSYGDEDKDNYMIRQGFKYYNKHFKK